MTNLSLPLADDVMSADDVTSYEDYDYGSLNYANETYPANVTHVATWEIVVKTAFYVPVILISMFGNIAIMVVVAKVKRMQVSEHLSI